MQNIQYVTALRWLPVIAVIVGLSHIGFAMETKATDPMIKQAIQKTLIQADTMQKNEVQVDVSDGAVTLKGTVPSLAQKQRVAQHAKRTRGVRTVKNEITVKPTTPQSDDDLRTRIESRIAQHAMNDTEADNISVSVDDGKVMLSGSASSWQERMQLETYVGNLRGVTAIDNKITVERMKPGKQAISDDEIRKTVDRRFKNEVRLDNTKIGLQVDDGQVQLSGSVRSADIKDVATQRAWVTGVTSVNASDLKVDPNLTYVKRTAMMRTRCDTGMGSSKREDDAEKRQHTAESLQSDVEYALLFNTATFAERDIMVSVDNESTVVLRGSVSSLYGKDAAMDAARGVRGVQKVDNRLEIESGDVSEAQLVQDVREALDWSWAVGDRRIEVTADKDGKVTLVGMVESESTKGAITDVVADVKGVTAVDNGLIVTDEGQRESGLADQGMSDPELKEEVESWLWWNMTVDSEDINVHVKEGIVTLKGTIDSQDEMREAIGAARSAGAKRVVNQLEMRRYTMK